MKYNFIAIEGNIGCGKTTLSEMLAEDFHCKLILEQFADNPFLPKFYDDPEGNAFPLELFFMAERYQQLRSLMNKELFSNKIIADYFLMKSKLFAQNNLKTDELLLFNRLSDIALQNLPKPDLLVYLHSDINRLKSNIIKRGREYEKNISNEYLMQIQNRYFDYFKKQQDYPVLILDITNVDFVSNNIIYQKIIGLLNASYDIGIFRVSF